MRKKVYEYFAENPNATHHMCAKVLNVSELEVVRYINELREDRLLNVNVLPLGNSIDADCSNFYSVSKPYHD